MISHGCRHLCGEHAGKKRPISVQCNPQLGRNVPHLVMKADNEFENFLVVERYNSVKEVPDQNATDWRLREWANPSHEAPKEA